MEIKRFYFKDLSNHFSNSETYFDYYIFDNTDNPPSKYKKPAMVVVPGGGYCFVSKREAEPIALAFLCEGFNCFVLNYTIHQIYPAPHLELAFMMHYIYEHADEFNIIKECINLVGFSAGGHLVGSYSYLFPELADMLGLKKDGLKPFSVALGYAVIDLLVSKEQMTTDTITNWDDKLREKLSIQKHITKDYPPAFIFSTLHDSCIPIDRHSYLLRDALEREGITYKLLEFDEGDHGGSLYQRGVFEVDYEHYDVAKAFLDSVKPNNRWVNECSEFILHLYEKRCLK